MSYTIDDSRIKFIDPQVYEYLIKNLNKIIYGTVIWDNNIFEGIYTSSDIKTLLFISPDTEKLNTGK